MLRPLTDEIPKRVLSTWLGSAQDRGQQINEFSRVLAQKPFILKRLRSLNERNLDQEVVKLYTHNEAIQAQVRWTLWGNGEEFSIISLDNKSNSKNHMPID
jgi:hypothetical protein